MIYVDSSVALATLLEESRRPDDAFWNAECIASRITDLEVRVRSVGRIPPERVTDDLEELFAHWEWIELTPETAGLLYLKPPAGLRTLDAIHLATLDFANREIGKTSLATYDRRLAAAAESMGFTVITP